MFYKVLHILIFCATEYINIYRVSKTLTPLAFYNFNMHEQI